MAVGFLTRCSFFGKVVCVASKNYYIGQTDKKFEVDELTENMAILFNKEIMDAVEKSANYVADDYLINGKPMIEIITKSDKIN